VRALIAFLAVTSCAPVEPPVGPTTYRVLFIGSLKTVIRFAGK
jgi:hypothetical protein